MAIHLGQKLNLGGVKMSKSINELCWISYEAIDVKPGMLISKQLAKTPRTVISIGKDDDQKTVTLIVESNWKYLSDVSYDHHVDVLCNSLTLNPIIEKVTS